MTAIGAVRRASIFIAIAIGIYLLQWGQQFLMPLVVAFLLMDVLAPTVEWLHARRIPNVLAVTLVTCALAVVVAGAIFLLSKQILSLTSQLPDYRGNIVQKMQVFRDSPLSRLTGAYKDVVKELSPATQPATQATHPTKAAAPSTAPVKVEVVESSGGAMATNLLSYTLGPLGNAGIIFALLFFLLLDRDLVRHRVRWLMRQADVKVSRETVEAASARVATYLRTQLIVNISYAAMVATSLASVQLPNAILLGAIGGALRYIPYVGPLIAITLPTVLAVAIFPGWGWPLVVLGIMLALEVFTNMVLETALFGVKAGVSSTGVILTCFFWGWIWGPMGLVLAVPMTVWIVLVGRHLPGVRALAVVLSAEEIASIESEHEPGGPMEPTEEGWAE